MAKMAAAGQVYLIGAGPGSFEYLTLAAQTCLATAGVVIYDALIDARIRALTPANCEWLCVGKRGGQPSTAQPQINQLLVEYCDRGKQVVRLKSGDPFIFGRALVEIEALTQAGCAYTVIPGLSSALAAPLLAGIPLTDRSLSQGFGVFTAHQPDTLNWAALAQLDTLVLLMGGRQLATIVAALVTAGRSPTTPMAIIRWAGQPEQQIWQGTLASIEQQVDGQALSPSVMVVGDVVQLRTQVLTPLSTPLAASLAPATPPAMTPPTLPPTPPHLTP